MFKSSGRKLMSKQCLGQGFPNCGSRPKSGSRRSVKWVAKVFWKYIHTYIRLIFSHLFVNLIKILFSSYHCSRSSPLSCQRAKLIKILTSRGNVTPTLRELHASPRKCQNVPLNDGPSPYKLISLLCFLTCYTLFISPIQTSSTIFIST